MTTRKRRGKDVTIPEQWVGNFPTNQTKSDRKDKARLKVLERKKRLVQEATFDWSSEEMLEEHFWEIVLK